MCYAVLVTVSGLLCCVPIVSPASDFVMATDSDAPTGAQSGITFGVALDVPWHAPEAYVHLHSDGVVDLDTVPDVLGSLADGRRQLLSVF